ncbi:hypothetical protein BB559_005975 [Furculomyces boomerangus]|uniref:Uncharacterized protein n=1 Tax=Furculomyces boomerangus TaxID=61424 RepID=A0A2T9Y5M2_9FUNG|nr:hypothetical protein BB559_005975 [Furculomyces boomerangus]
MYQRFSLNQPVSFRSATFLSRTLKSPSIPLRNYTSNQFKLKPSFEIALRAACLQLMLARWGLETATKLDFAKSNEFKIDDRRMRAFESITNTALNGGLSESLTEKEMEMLQKDPGTWEYQDFSYGKFWESLGKYIFIFQTCFYKLCILAWMLGRRNEIPSYFSSFDRVLLFQSTGILPGDSKTIDSFINSYMSLQAKFSLEDTILKREIDIAEIWYWRARLQVLLDLKDQIIKEQENKESGNEKKSNIEKIIEKELLKKNVPHSLRSIIKNSKGVLESATKRAIDLQLLSQSDTEDFDIVIEVLDDQKNHPNASSKPAETTIPYNKLEKKDHDALMDIAEARMMAFAWTTGKLDKWDPEKMLQVGSINPLNILWTPDE